MNQLVSFLLLASSIYVAQSAFAQQSFTSCSAAFVGNRMVVDAYTPTGKCRLSNKATGELTVQTVDLSPTKSTATGKIDFKVAIRDKATGTLHLYSNKTYRQIPVQRVLTACRKGDQIVLLTVDSRYALPHNEILIQ